jgi:putative component of membrane protein insertase Oxa1/YidC/SpoIIIJ protein YidD
LPSKQRVAVAALAIQKVGLRRGFAVLRIITGWAFCWNSLGHRPTVSEYAIWAYETAGVSKATSYSDIKLFRQVFDKCDDPSPVVEHQRAKIAEAGSQSMGAAIVAGLMVPVD